MRRVLAAVLFVLVCVSLAACSGDAGTGTNTVNAPVGAVPGPAGAVAIPENTLDTHSPIEVANDQPMPRIADSVPQAVLTRLDRKQAMLIYYYDSSELLTKDQRPEIDAVMKAYRGLIDLISYDEATPLASLEGTQNTELQKAMRMAGLPQVQVRHAPYFLFVDRFGRITGRYAGPVDRNLLEREVLRATE